MREILIFIVSFIVCYISVIFVSSFATLSFSGYDISRWDIVSRAIFMGFVLTITLTLVLMDYN